MGILLPCKKKINKIFKEFQNWITDLVYAWNDAKPTAIHWDTKVVKLFVL